ncbi:MAG: phosphatase PAP2 family protein [Vicinamibacterales bacterium]
MVPSLWIPVLCGALGAGVQAPVSTTPSPEPAVQVAPPVERPLTRIVPNLGRDLKGLGHRDTLLIVGVGGIAAILAQQGDDRGYAWGASQPAGAWTDIGRMTGDGWVQGGLAVATWGVGRLTDAPLTTHVGSDLIRAQTLNMVTTRVLKIAVDRQRPSGGGHAFPSGHTSASFTTAGVLHRHFGWKAGVPAYAVAGFIAATRVRDRAHWVSDTVFGAALGLTAAWTVTRGHDQHTWSITPVATPTSAGLVVRW